MNTLRCLVMTLALPGMLTLSARAQGKPVPASVDTVESLETLTQFLAKEKMPWTHWWNGSAGGIIGAWDVRSYPTIYVIDAKGGIRHKDLRGEELEKAVNALLAK